MSTVTDHENVENHDGKSYFLESRNWRDLGIVEIMTENPSVAEYVAGMEERLLKSEKLRDE